ncbi:alpha-ketoacid dehydrogenase subunit beta [Chloroflexota bacterium]
MRKVTYLEAQHEALVEEMERDPTVFALGETIQAMSTMGLWEGLSTKFGFNRVRDTAISEQAILGSAIGAAATGTRPIASLMFVDFMGVCADELINQLQMTYMFGGKIKLPLTIIAGCGAGNQVAAQHSKSLFGWLMNVKSLKIVIPSTAYDAKGLLKSAIRDDNPVVYLTHKMSAGGTSEIPDEEYLIPLGQADVKREGTDVTIISIAYSVNRALNAADTLQQQGISAEVVDLRTLAPLDKETIFKSVSKTGRLVVTTEEPITGSAAGEIAALVADEGFDYLDAPIKRVCAPDTPIPFNAMLEKTWIPDENDIIKAVKEIV